MIAVDRRTLLAALAGEMAMTGTMGVTHAQAQTQTQAQTQALALALYTAGPGSAFLPYGQGIATLVNAGDAARVTVKESKGSIDNLTAVEADPMALGCAFLGTALEALSGTGFAAGKPYRNVRALFPMYPTSFMTAALASANIRSIADLDGKKVGTGPAGGPAEGYFRALAELVGIKPSIVSGSPADQAKQFLAREIDAFWQGAVVPVPSLVAVAAAAEIVVFGLTESEITAMRSKYPFMAPLTIAADTYKGQAKAFKSISAWNVIVAHKDLPDAVAEVVVKSVLFATNRNDALGPPGIWTVAANAANNTIVPYHPGAERALGIKRS
jgi:uncharacterized protein